MKMQPKNSVQIADMIDVLNDDKDSRLMKMMDAINTRMGKATVRLAGDGMGQAGR